jgi:hypothetical protein
VVVGLGVAGLVYGMTYAKTRVIIVDSIMVFLLGVPLIYTLVLFIQIPLLAFGLVQFSAHTYFVTSILGALVGTGLCVLWNLKGTFSKASESTDDERFDIERWFFDGVSWRTAIAFVIAASFVIPKPKPAALITLGVAWGVVAAVVQLVFTVLVDHESVRKGWLRIVMVEILVVLILLFGLLTNIPHLPMMIQALELGLSAALACAMTYGLVYLSTTAITLLRAKETTTAARARRASHIK